MKNIHKNKHNSIPNFKSVLFAFIFTAFLAVNTVNAASKIYILEPTVNNYVLRPNKPLPPSCRLGKVIRIAACRGEYEPASFVIETDQTLKNVRVEVGQLKSGSAKIAADAVDIRIVVPFFRRITDWPDTVNWILLHDPSLLKTVIELQPTAITAIKNNGKEGKKVYNRAMYFTREPIDTDTLQPTDIERRRQFWLTVHVPEKARKGNGPTLIECKTYRYRGHSRFENPTYRTKEELQQWKKRDPIDLFADFLLKDHKIEKDRLEKIGSEVDAVMDAAVKFSEQSPDPGPLDYKDYIFA